MSTRPLRLVPKNDDPFLGLPSDSQPRTYSYSEREIERSQARIAAILGPEEVARLEADSFDYDAFETIPIPGGGPDLLGSRPARVNPRTATAARRPALTYVIAGFVLAAAIVILGLLALLPASAGGKLPGGLLPPGHPAAFIRSAVA